MPATRILMGVVGRPHGVRGLVRVQCYATDPARLPALGPFDDGHGGRLVLRWRGPGIAAIGRLDASGAVAWVESRDEAERLVNLPLYADRARLPEPAAEEYYIADLIGMEAFDAEGQPLGAVSSVLDFGAGASLEIGPLLVPFTRAAVPAIDLAGGRVTVVPPTEILAPRDRQAGR